VWKPSLHLSLFDLNFINRRRESNNKMKNIILKGCHYSLIPSLGIKYLKQPIDEITQKHTFMFMENCRYTLNKEDQYDWNKLFGLFIGINGIHKNSYRFVWRYNNVSDIIEIGIYTYLNSVRNYNTFCNVKINKLIDLEINLLKIENGMIVHFKSDCKEERVEYIMKGKIKGCLVFNAGLYFGGNNTAPHTMSIKIE
jgi:hypothetical protein